VEVGSESFPLPYGGLMRAERSGHGRLVALSAAEVLRLLADARLGRVAYSDRGLPGVQVVSHVVDRGDVVFRCHGQPPVIAPGRGYVVLAYEADAVDPGTLTGWRVTVTGSAALVRRGNEVARLDGLLPSWPAGADGGHLVRLHPGVLSGYRFVAAAV
jgi:Pyridoxamine 5'-phosphate oxidase